MEQAQNDSTAIRFSVIIPSFNAEKTIARAIDSILAQTYPPYEIIVVDDGSTDKTMELLHNNYREQVRFKQKVMNGGSGVARNVGMDMATGDYIAFLDADDIWHKDKLMLVHALLVSMPGISFFYHPYTLEHLSGKSLPENVKVYNLPFVKLLPGNIIATSCAVIRNDPSFRFEPTMRYSEDFDLWLRIGYKYKIYYTNIPLTQIFRPFLSPGGVSEKKWNMRKGEMRAYVRLVKLNILFALLLPLLLFNSIGKHLYKIVFRKQATRPLPIFL